MDNENHVFDSNFFKVYNDYVVEFIQLPRENLPAYQILIFFTSHMDRRNKLIVSISCLYELLNLSKSSIIRGIRYLKEHGWICVLKSGRSNIYVVNPGFAWKDRIMEKKFCEFDGKVIISSKENKKEFEELLIKNKVFKKIERK